MVSSDMNLFVRQCLPAFFHWMTAINFLCLLITPHTHAQTFPNKQVTLVVPFTTGGSNDIFARALAAELHATWAQSVIVENRSGGGGSLGANYVSKMPSDGYTILLMSSAFTINAAIQPGVAPDPITSFKPIALIAKGPMMLVASIASGIKTQRDIISSAQSQPARINYATAGNGSVTHLAMEMLASNANIKLTQVPYKGGSQAITDVIGGHTQLYMGSIPQVLPHARSGKVTALGVTSLYPSPIATDIAPLTQTFAGYDLELWWGLFSPVGLSETLANKINQDVNNALSNAKMKEFVTKEGAVSTPMTPDQFANFVRTELTRWREVVKKSNIKSD